MPWVTYREGEGEREGYPSMVVMVAKTHTHTHRKDTQLHGERMTEATNKIVS